MSNSNQHSAAEALFKQYLAELGFSDHPEMSETARRFTALLNDHRPSSPPAVSTFDVDSTGLITLENIPFRSLCAHHLMPFFGIASVRYLPRGVVAGLSSITNAVHHFARRPTLQETMAEQIASHLDTALTPLGLSVTLTARQMCLEMCTPTQGTQITVTARRGDHASMSESS